MCLNSRVVIQQDSGCSPQTQHTATNIDSALTCTSLNYRLTLCSQASVCLWRIFLFECKLYQIWNRRYSNMNAARTNACYDLFFSTTARHDFSPVHLRPCWSGSCCYCNGETMKENSNNNNNTSLNISLLPDRNTVLKDLGILKTLRRAFKADKTSAESSCCLQRPESAGV